MAFKRNKWAYLRLLSSADELAVALDRLLRSVAGSDLPPHHPAVDNARQTYERYRRALELNAQNAAPSPAIQLHRPGGRRVSA